MTKAVTWPITRLSNVADVLFSNVDKHALDDETSVRLCNYVDVYKNEKITSGIEFMEASAAAREIARFQVRRDDVLVTKDSETPDDIAIPALVAEDLPGVLCGYHLAMIRPVSNSVCGPFLYWLHASKEFRAHYESNAVGVTRFGLSQHSFKAAPIPLPPLPEQQRIAAFLDASCQAIDAAVAAKRKQIEVLGATLRSNIAKAVTMGIQSGAELRPVAQDWLNEVPRHWRVVRIKRVLSRLDYGISESTNPEGSIPVLKMGHIADGELSFASLDYVDAVEEVLLLEENDILYNRTNSPDQVGKAAIFRKDKKDRITFASYLVRLRVNHEAWPEFLNFVLNSDGFLAFVRRLAIPSVQQSNLNSTRYGRMLIPVPPLLEQKQIADCLSGKVAKARRVREILERQIQTLTAYRKSLIHECVTGTRRVTEADLHKALAHAPRDPVA